MATDAFVWILLGIVQVGTAVYGGIVSAKTLPSKSYHRTVHVLGFVGLGILGVVLIVFSGLRAYDAQKANEKTQAELRHDVTVANDKMTQSLLAQEYMKGQLNSIGTVMTKLGERNADPVLGQMSSTIAKLAGNYPPSSAKSEESVYSGQKTESSLIHSGPGVLRSITIQPSGTKECTVKIYDGIDAAGRQMDTYTIDAGIRQTGGWVSRSIPFTKGLFVQMTNCSSYGAEYYPKRN